LYICILVSEVILYRQNLPYSDSWSGITLIHFYGVILTATATTIEPSPRESETKCIYLSNHVTPKMNPIQEKL
jgi:hypothetical protein